MLHYLFEYKRTCADEPAYTNTCFMPHNDLVKMWPAIEGLLPRPKPCGEIWEFSLLHDLERITIKTVGLVEEQS